MDYYGGYGPPMRGRGGRGGPMPPVSLGSEVSCI